MAEEKEKGFYVSYDSYKNVLNNINISVKNGEKIAIIGKSGCGKSTLLKLLNKFYIADGGKINVGDININDMPVNHLRKSVGYVAQDPVIFSTSIRENVLLGDKKSDKEVMAILRECGLAEDVYVFDEEEYLNRNAITLSKGERQRLGLARELLKKPQILILDEVTNNLDEVNKNRICDVVFNKRSTCIVATHCLDVAKRCNRILVMNEGKIVEWEAYSG